MNKCSTNKFRERLSFAKLEFDHPKDTNYFSLITQYLFSFKHCFLDLFIFVFVFGIGFVLRMDK